MSLDFSDFLEVLSNDVFDEKPVSIEEFTQSKDYLGVPPLSEEQYRLIKASSQVYKEETLYEFMTMEDAKTRWSQTFNEVISIFGKGAGKDYCSVISCCYIVYQLMCLKDPQEYYGKPSSDFIDIMNVALNAQQANNVFFAGLKNRLKNSPWFQGKYYTRANEIEFEKNIRLISGHSESESLEGYNVLVVVLDEIAGFDQDTTSGIKSKRITAESTYKMHRASVESRFGKQGKLILLSFPRHANDFIMQKYREVVGDKEVVHRKHTFKLDPDLPDDIEDNKFSIEWEEDHITSYRFPGVYAIRRPTWEVNPTKSIDDFALSFYRDTADSMGRFAAHPAETVDAFFHDYEKIESAFNQPNGISSDGIFQSWLKPEEDVQYFIHVDLAQVHDRAVVSMSHVSAWRHVELFGQKFSIEPYVKVDCVRYWTPTKQNPIEFQHIQDFIISLSDRGFNIKLVTFDQWQSHTMMEDLARYGMKTRRLSVNNNEYIDMKKVIMEGRVQGPEITLLIDEFKHMRMFPNGKIDHPQSGSSDLVDSVTGSVISAAANADRNTNHEIQVYTAADIKRAAREESTMEEERPGRKIKPPEKEMPEELSNWLGRMRKI